MNSNQIEKAKKGPCIPRLYWACALGGALFGLYCLTWLGANHTDDIYSYAALKIPGWGRADTIGTAAVLDLQLKAVALRISRIFLEYGYQFIVFPAGFGILLAWLANVARRNKFARWFAVYLWTFVALSCLAAGYGFVAGTFFDESYSFLPEPPTIAQRLFTAMRDSGNAIYGFNITCIIPLCAFIAASVSLFFPKRSSAVAAHGLGAEPSANIELPAHGTSGEQNECVSNDIETPVEESVVINIKQKQKETI